MQSTNKGDRQEHRELSQQQERRYRVEVGRQVVGAWKIRLSVFSAMEKLDHQLKVRMEGEVVFTARWENAK